MISKKEFIIEIESKIDIATLSLGAQEYWNMFKDEQKKDKPLFTDNGKLILKYLQEHDSERSTWKASDVAEGLFVSSRTVSGAIRKLVTDGFVEKVSTDPVVYAITEKGKNIEIV